MLFGALIFCSIAGNLTVVWYGFKSADQLFSRFLVDNYFQHFYFQDRSQSRKNEDSNELLSIKSRNF